MEYTKALLEFIKNRPNNELPVEYIVENKSRKFTY